MARAHLRYTVKDINGNVIQNALVNVYLQGTTTPVSDMYAGSSGGSPITTLTSNVQGEVEAWFTTPKFVDLNVTDNGDTAHYPGSSELLSGTAFTETIEVLPRPDNRPFLNLKDYGVIGDGVTDDTAAINDAIETLDASIGGTIYFPPGTYLVSGSQGFGSITDRDNIELRGCGKASVIKRSTAGATNTRIGSFSNCDNLQIRNLTWDINNSTGGTCGMVANGCTGVRIENCFGLDSNVNGSAGGDHYWALVQTSTDVFITDNIVSDVELCEVNNCRRVKILDNHVYDCPSTTAIGGFAVTDGYYFEDYEIAGNYISNPTEYGITFRQEVNGDSNNIFRRINIHHNTVFYDGTSDYKTSAIQFRLSVTGTGNVAEDIWIEDNLVYITTGTTYSATGDEQPIQSYSTSATAYTDRLRFARNTVFVGSTSVVGYGMYVRGGRYASIEDNTVHGHASSAGFQFSTLVNASVARNVAIGVDSGIRTVTLDGCRVRDNIVSAATTAFTADANTSGNNRFSRNVALGSPSTVWSGSGSAGDIFEGEKTPNSGSNIGVHLEGQRSDAPKFLVTTNDSPSAVDQEGGAVWVGLASRVASIRAICDTDFGGGETWGSQPRVGLALYVFTPTGATVGARIDANPASTETSLLIRRNVGGTFSLVQVTMGAADSGGAGYKLLRVPN